MSEAKKSEQGHGPRLTGVFDTRRGQLPFWKRIQVPIFASAAIALVRTIGPTLRIDGLGLDHVKRPFVSGQPCIFCFWHRGLFPILWFARNRPIAVLTSSHFDGQWAGRITRHMGLELAVGSSTRGGLSGLLDLEDRVLHGWHAGFAVDGPRGPRYVAKRGPVFLAQRTGCPILCVHAHSQSAITLKQTWDQLQISLPFSRVALVFSPPIWVPSDASPEMLGRKYTEMQRQMEIARDTAESWYERSPAEQQRDRALLNSGTGLGAAG